MPRLLASLGRDPEEALVKANDASTAATLDASTDEARRIELFGSPHFAVQGEVLWGDDRLEEAIEWAIRGGCTQ